MATENTSGAFFVRHEKEAPEGHAPKWRHAIEGQRTSDEFPRSRHRLIRFERQPLAHRPRCECHPCARPHPSSGQLRNPAFAGRLMCEP